MSQSKSSQPRHPLSERHFRQIVIRDEHLTNRMRPIWGLTWRPGDQTGSFLGKLFRPLGSAVMMVQVPYQRPGQRLGLGLFGVTALVDPNSPTSVHYSDVRLRHEFHFVPRPGARGTVLDPSDGRGGNASWVQLGLEVDHVRQRAVERNFMLSPVPEMPAVFFGYASRDHAMSMYSVTPTLRQLAAGGVEINWEGDSLGQLAAFSSESAHAKEQVFNSWTPEQQEQRLHEAWESALIEPAGTMNTTGLWLVPHALVSSAFSSTRVFEYFGGLVGAHVFNPARKLTGKKIPNPALEVAKAASVDLVKDLEAASATTEGTPEYQEIEQRLISLVPAYRQVTGASADIDDNDLLRALCAYAEPVQIELPIAELSEAAQLQEMRQMLKPHISEACTDEDVLNAVRNPAGALYASGLAAIQSLRRDIRVPLEDSMFFSPEALGRERVSAQFWYDLPHPRPAKQKAPQHVEEASQVVADAA